MKRCREVIRGEVKGWEIFCPACKAEHFFDDTWEFNNSFRNPSFKPSLRIEYEAEGEVHMCHFIVKRGIIAYVEDSTHNLAGRIMYLPDLERLPQ